MKYFFSLLMLYNIWISMPTFLLIYHNIVSSVILIRTFSVISLGYRQTCSTQVQLCHNCDRTGCSQGGAESLISCLLEYYSAPAALKK